MTPDDFTVPTMLARFARAGDVWAPFYAEPPGSIAGALEMFERDERETGAAEMPYPPEYPKMPGEPSRVQPSRARND